MVILNKLSAIIRQYHPSVSKLFVEYYINTLEKLIHEKLEQRILTLQDKFAELGKSIYLGLPQFLQMNNHSNYMSHGIT